MIYGLNTFDYTGVGMAHLSSIENTIHRLARADLSMPAMLAQSEQNILKLVGDNDLSAFTMGAAEKSIVESNWDVLQDSTRRASEIIADGAVQTVLKSMRVNTREMGGCDVIRKMDSICESLLNTGFSRDPWRSLTDGAAHSIIKSVRGFEDYSAVGTVASLSERLSKLNISAYQRSNLAEMIRKPLIDSNTLTDYYNDDVESAEPSTKSETVDTPALKNGADTQDRRKVRVIMDKIMQSDSFQMMLIISAFKDGVESSFELLEIIYDFLLFITG